MLNRIGLETENNCHYVQISMLKNQSSKQLFLTIPINISKIGLPATGTILKYPPAQESNPETHWATHSHHMVKLVKKIWDM